MYNARSVFGYGSKQERRESERDKARDVSPAVLIITRIDTNFPLLCFPRNARAKNILWLMGSPSPALCGDKHTELCTALPEPYARALTLFPTIYTRTYIYILIYISSSYRPAPVLLLLLLYRPHHPLSSFTTSCRRLGSNKPARVAPHRAPLTRRKTSLSHYFPATTIRLNYLRVLYTHTANRHRCRAGMGVASATSIDCHWMSARKATSRIHYYYYINTVAGVYTRARRKSF